MFSKSEVEKFRHNNKALRWGQAFHSFFKLHKVTGADKNFCDKLFVEVDEAKAKNMVASRIDKNQ